MARVCDGAPGVAGVEVNISCPNVKKGGHGLRRRPADDPRGSGRGPQGDPAARDPQAVPQRRRHHASSRAPPRRRAPTRSPASTPCWASRSTSRRDGRGSAFGTGGLSGPAIRPIAVRMAWQAARAVSIPVIGIGGIASADGRARVPDRRLPRRPDRHRELRRSRRSTTACSTGLRPDLGRHGLARHQRGRGHARVPGPREGRRRKTEDAVKTRDRLIVALDVPNAEDGPDARRPAVPGTSGCSRSAARLFTAAGPEFVREIGGRGERVFLDLKFHDIPNTVAGAVASAAASASRLARRPRARRPGDAGGRRSARCRRSERGSLAITVLTSHDERTLGEIGVGGGADRTPCAGSRSWRRTRDSTASWRRRTRWRSSARRAGASS